MNYWSIDPEDNESEWERATWNFNSGYYKRRQEQQERSNPPASFKEEEDPPTYDPWTGGYF
jgi:hypothetical protein